jgi:hypothetical protein
MTTIRTGSPVIRVRLCTRSALAAILAVTASLGARPAMAQVAAPAIPTMFQHKWFQIALESGRIAFVSSRVGGMSTNSATPDRKERLSVQNNGASQALDYELATKQEKLVVQMSTSGQATLRRTPEGDSRVIPVEYQQSPREPIRVTIGPPDAPQKFEAANLWHLALREPELAKRHLFPLLQILKPEWSLEKTAAEIEAALVAAAASLERPDTAKWAALVRNLGDERFAVRESADRQLREAGRSIVVYLERLDRGRLEPEQDYRIRRILQTLSSGRGADETPERAASWLSGDPTTWWLLMRREPETTRRLAAKRLELAVGHTIQFDPAAPPGVREQQLEQIKAQLPRK